MIEDSFDFFQAEGIHHQTFWDGHQHHVADYKLTTNELCMRVKEILDRATILIYLNGEADVIMRYFISWFNLIKNDFPFLVWVDDDGDLGRQFFYETFSGSTSRFYLGAGMKIPAEAFKNSQAALEVEDTENMYVDMPKCQMGDCTNPANNTIEIKVGLSICVCDAHKKSISEQLAKVN